MNIKMYVPISAHQLRMVTNDEYYRSCYVKDYEKFLGSLTLNDTYSILVQLLFGSEDGNAWIDISVQKKKEDGTYTGDPFAIGEALHELGSVEMEFHGVFVEINIVEA